MKSFAWTCVVGLLLPQGCGDDGGDIDGQPVAPTVTVCTVDADCGPTAYCNSAGRCEPVVQLNGFTALLEDQYICMPDHQNPAQCADYRFTFAIANHDSSRSIARLERVEFSVAEVSIATRSNCTREPWTVAANGTSVLIDVWFLYRGGAYDGHWPAFNIPCGIGDLTPEITEGVLPAPLEGLATIVIDSRMDDGILVTSAANAMLAR